MPGKPRKSMPGEAEEVLARRSIVESYMPNDGKDVIRVLTGFYKADGTEISFFAVQYGASHDYVLQDACEFLKDADKAGVVLKPTVLHDLAKTYGLKVSEDLSLFDDQKGDLDDRKYRFTACLVGFDAILRMWGSQAPVRIEPEGK